MERNDRARVIRLFWSEAFHEGEMRLSGAPVQHARVRRAQRGDQLRLIDGRGCVASAEILSLGKDAMLVSVNEVTAVQRPSGLEVIVPVADRERMLLAAEKCVELQITSWRPAHFIRSRSVSPRGEGEKFREKIKARMQSALEQCGGAWLPEVHEELDASEAFVLTGRQWKRLLLDVSGSPLTQLASNGPTAIAVGPEGGLDPDEVAVAEGAGWVTASLASTILRFETAVIAGAAVIRAAQLSSGSV